MTSEKKIVPQKATVRKKPEVTKQKPIEESSAKAFFSSSSPLTSICKKQ